MGAPAVDRAANQPDALRAPLAANARLPWVSRGWRDDASQRSVIEATAERARLDAQRAEDRKADAARLDRIETDIHAMRNLLFSAFQRGEGPPG